jgi:hypothetical protein
MKKLSILVLVFCTILSVASATDWHETVKKKRHKSTARTKGGPQYSRPGKSLNYAWDSTAASWDPYNSTVYQYNTHGDPVETTDYDFSGVTPQNKTVSVYGAFYNIVKSYNLSWNGSSWDSTYKMTYTYDTYGNETSYIGEYYTPGGWQISSGNKTAYTYTSSGLISTAESEYYSSFSSAWEKDIKETFI